MDKKNTMLLTVIAVATLLVAVVGATFAYFSIATTNDGGTTAVTGTTQEVGTVALTNPTSTLKLDLTAEDMSSANQGKAYYATLPSTVGGYDTTATPRQVALATVTGGEEGTKYTCTFDLSVAVAGTMKDSLVKGDASIVFSGALTETSDLTEVAATREVSFTSFTDTASVSAYVVMNNTTAEQNDLAGKTLTVTLSNSDLTCDVVK